MVVVDEAYVEFAGATVADLLGQILEQTRADELIVAMNVADPAARLRSYELLARALLVPPESRPPRLLHQGQG